MRRVLALVVLTIVIVCMSSVESASTQSRNDKFSPKVEPALLRQLSEEGKARIIVEVSATKSGSLQDQANVLSVLMGGDSDQVQSLWIINGVVARADLKTVLDLAALPEVHIVRQEREFHIEDPPGVVSAAPTSVGQNIVQIRANLAWSALQLDGTGTVVASVDTGVDWLHPALQANYRGYNLSGPTIHSCNWFDATGEGALYPVDAYGHGTHTMGTAVGEDGIGVAPGAQWITARAFDNGGNARESWLHTALEWMIDPGPGCVPPNIVFNSWGAASGDTSVFRPDVIALRAAGIVAPFAAGNMGPYDRSVVAPASYPETLAVGAVDSKNAIASFSSRGPSPWFMPWTVKPDITAPGMDVLSAIPGGGYGKSSGTSMATPHIAGVAALILQANPALTVTQVEDIIEHTAKRLGTPPPNNTYGWGIVDAYAASVLASNASTVQGIVTDGTGTFLSKVVVEAVSESDSTSSSVVTDSNGRYTIGLATGTYTVHASVFGYAPSSAVVIVQAGKTLIHNFALDTLPAGMLKGHVTSNSQAIWQGYNLFLPVIIEDQRHGGGIAVETTHFPPQTISISIKGTPLSITADSDGYYHSILPEGMYTIVARSLGYSVTTTTSVHVVANHTTTRDFDLMPVPRILLVDGGAWYYDSQILYYKQALDALYYPYDVWTIKDPVTEVPSANDLDQYNVVFWSCPKDSPGYIGASNVLSAFLDGGGRLFLSGQDVAYYDDNFLYIHAPYFRYYIRAGFVDETGIIDIEGMAGGLLDGLTFQIAGPGGANNQVTPDQIESVGGNTSSIASYMGDGSSGQQVGPGLPYKVVFLPFGLEGIASYQARREVVGRSLEWLSK